MPSQNPLLQEKSASLGGKILEKLIGFPRYVKRAILMSLDFGLMLMALWAAYSLRLGIFYWPEGGSLKLLLLAGPAIGVLCFHYNGLYKLITRFYGSRETVRIFFSVSIAVLVWALLIYMTRFTLAQVPRSVIVMYGLFSMMFIWGNRVFLAYLLRHLLPFAGRRSSGNAVPVLIYGVNDVAHKLAQELSNSTTQRLVGFVDENASLWRQVLFGVRVYNPERIADIVGELGIREVFLADPEMRKRDKRALLNKLAPLSVELKALSPMHLLASNEVLVSDLRQVGLEDLLGRSPVPPDVELLQKTVTGKTVMITGAGGSIGSELARQVLQLGPKKLVLFERSELALYQIEIELKDQIKAGFAGLTAASSNEVVKGRAEGPLAPMGPEIVGVLGSVTQEAHIRNVMAAHGIQTLYHAAAYKHVPIVEDNPFVGLENNVLGTIATAEAAIAAGVELFVLISTDKAVRPTNVMGASKRIAELYLQAIADRPEVKTVFTMVRFGNVLGSSGSVVGRFQAQIEKGGPITVTHPEIVRYFMMIPEAAQLVIQAGGLASGGEVFVLDMGQPVKIIDLARSMINLSGLEVADVANPDGDIAIEFIGLREGEKLYEELLINENSTPTDHASIIRNHESYLPLETLTLDLDQLKIAIKDNDRPAVDALLLKLVEGYQLNGQLSCKSAAPMGEESGAKIASTTGDGVGAEKQLPLS